MAKKGSAKLDAEIGQLYALPLGEFTPARNKLAARLRKDGEKSASERVKELVKPPASAWAVNVLFADDRQRMEALLAAGERARQAQGETLSRGTAETLRSALQEERKLRGDLRRRAVDLLKKDGRDPGREVTDRIAVNLEALALNPDAAEAAQRGWLDQDLEPPGFEILAGLQLGAAPPAPAKEETKPAPLRGGKEDSVREREDAKARERIARAEEKVARAADEAARLREEAQRAEQSAAEAERAAEEARRRATAAGESAVRARARSERAEEQLAKAQADLEGLR